MVLIPRIIICVCLAVAAVTSFPLRAMAVTQEQIDQSAGHQYSADLRVSACNAAIESGRWQGKDLSWAYNDRGNAFQAKRDFDRAIADHSEAIRLDPKNARAYDNRGTAWQEKGDFDRAIADYNQAIQLKTAWPAPVIRLYLGQLTPAAVRVAAENPDANVRMGQACEADFYNGEFALRGGNKVEAKRLFAIAAANCPKDFFDYSSAVAELKAFGP